MDRHKICHLHTIKLRTSRLDINKDTKHKTRKDRIKRVTKIGCINIHKQTIKQKCLHSQEDVKKDLISLRGVYAHINYQLM